MIPESLKPDATACKRWVYHDDIIKYTVNKTLIKEELTDLLSTKRPIEIRKKNFISSSTILLDFNEKTISLDIPAQWGPLKGIVDMYYSYTGQPNRVMRTEIIKTGSSDISLKFPFLLAESEYRQFYRIRVPSISMIEAYTKSKTGRKKICFEGKIKDISMKGVCSLTTNIYSPTNLRHETTIEEIRLKLMLAETEFFGEIVIKDPVIVRLRPIGLKKDNKTGYEVAFSFKPDSKTSDRIFEYIRLRERHLS